MLDVLTRGIKGALALLLATAACTPPAPSATRDLVTVEPALAVAALQQPVDYEDDAPAGGPSQNLPASLSAAATPKVGPLPAPVRRLIYKGVLSVPQGFRSDDGSYDLIIHLNGHPESVEGAVAQTGLNAVLYVVNLGRMGSGSYESMMQDANALQRLELTVGDGLRLLVPGLKSTARRVALTSWSAGYGGVMKALSFARAAERLDAVLLADGLHVGFKPGSLREPSEMLLAPFQRFAERATRGEVLMGISHTDIETYGYASCRQSTDGLLGLLHLSRTPASEPQLRTTHATSRVDAGDFHVLGFDGNGKDAHADHLHGLDKTLFPLLASRWATAPSHLRRRSSTPPRPSLARCGPGDAPRADRLAGPARAMVAGE